jgi:hypothetical protein
MVAALTGAMSVKQPLPDGVQRRAAEPGTAPLPKGTQRRRLFEDLVLIGPAGVIGSAYYHGSLNQTDMFVCFGIIAVMYTHAWTVPQMRLPWMHDRLDEVAVVEPEYYLEGEKEAD